MSAVRRCDGCERIEADEEKSDLWLYFAWRKHPKLVTIFDGLLGERENAVMRYEFCSLRCAASKLFVMDVEEQWTK